MILMILTVLVLFVYSLVERQRILASIMGSVQEESPDPPEAPPEPEPKFFDTKFNLLKKLTHDHDAPG